MHQAPSTSSIREFGYRSPPRPAATGTRSSTALVRLNAGRAIGSRRRRRVCWPLVLAVVAPLFATGLVWVMVSACIYTQHRLMEVYATFS